MSPVEDEPAPNPESSRNPMRIHYAEDVETGRHGRLYRRGSTDNDSMSIRSISRRRVVEPGVILPLQYRTL